MRGQSSHGSAGLHGMKDMSQHDEWSRSGRRSDLKFNGRRIASRDAGNDSDRQATRGSSSGAGRPHQQRSREMQRTDEELEKEREREGGWGREGVLSVSSSGFGFQEGNPIFILVFSSGAGAGKNDTNEERRTVHRTFEQQALERRHSTRDAAFTGSTRS